MGVPIDLSQTFRAGQPRKLFDGSQYVGAGNDLSFDVDANGRFLMTRTARPLRLAAASGRSDWFQELERLVAASR